MEKKGDMKGKSGFGYIALYATAERTRYTLSVVLAVLGVVFELLPYVAIARIVVMLIARVFTISSYYPAFAAIGLGVLCKVLLHNLSTTISHKATFRVLSSIREAIAKKLVTVPMGVSLDMDSGVMKSTMVEKIDGIEPILAHAVPEMTSNLLVPLGIIAYIFALDVRMGFASLIVVPIGFLGLAGAMKDYERRFRKMTDVAKHMNNTAIEYINGIEVIKAFSHTASSYEKYKKAVDDNRAYGLEWMRSVQAPFSLALSAFPAILIGVLPIGALLVKNGSLASADLITIILVSLGIFGPILKAMSFTDELAKVNTVMADIGRIIAQEDMVRPSRDVAITDSTITVDNVSFSYHEERVLHGVSLTFAQGEVSALVGPSGGGKSTIAKLVASFWDVDGGEITIGGQNVKTIPLAQLNARIAYVSQDTFLFNESIMENIRKGDGTAGDSEVIEAAKASGCHEFILSLEKGYDTIVGNGGSHLSGGERQRITIARAMLKDADVIVLDEATAYTDPENEAIIQESVSRLTRDKTLIVIAHRLGTIIDSDHIYVINNGRVDSHGRFDELMETSELFQSMWEAHRSARDEKTEVKFSA